jgi:hypothetical protein
MYADEGERWMVVAIGDDEDPRYVAVVRDSVADVQRSASSVAVEAPEASTVCLGWSRHRRTTHWQSSVGTGRAFRLR